MFPGIVFPPNSMYNNVIFPLADLMGRRQSVKNTDGLGNRSCLA